MQLLSLLDSREHELGRVALSRPQGCLGPQEEGKGGEKGRILSSHGFRMTEFQALREVERSHVLCISTNPYD